LRKRRMMASTKSSTRVPSTNTNGTMIFIGEGRATEERKEQVR